MARHALTGKRHKLPRGMRGRAQHRAISYFWEYVVVKTALWVAVKVMTPRMD